MSNESNSIQILQKYWGYESFRPPQEQIIESVLERKDTFVLMPTGGGKSLCYQVPAMILGGLTLVITPLIALMKDQVAHLQDKGIEARALHSGLYRDEIEGILERALHGRIKLLYLSPERLQSELFGSYLPELDVSLIAVDEAHCISQWGYDFRPAYLDIASIREYTEAPMLALTGSADQQVIEDIISKLEFRQGYEVFKKSFVRQNLCYRVKYASQKSNTVIADYKKGFSSIVYAGTRGNTEKISSRLNQRGLASDYYHAGLSADQREKKQQNWMHQNPPMMVCTNAFGMGIDKSNVRQVFHTQIPPSPEAYYQEAGRAGRDGKFATATLIYSDRDLQYLDLQLLHNNFTYSEAQKIYDLLHASIGVGYDEGQGQYHSLDEVALSQRLGMSIHKVLKFLKFMEQEGYWIYNEQEWDLRPSLKCLQTPQQYDSTGSSPEGEVLGALYRLYQNIRYSYLKINVEDISRLLNISPDKALHGLKELDRNGALDLRIPTGGSSIVLLRDRVQSDHLSYNQSKLAKLRKRDEIKVKQMKAYVKNTNICRQKFLISFFGEEVSEDCGICDVCQQERGTISKDKLITFVSSLDEPHIKAVRQKFFVQDKQAFVNWIRLGLQLKWWDISSTGSIKLLKN